MQRSQVLLELCSSSLPSVHKEQTGHGGGLLGEIGQQVRAAPKAAEGFHVVWMEEAKPRAALANGHMESPEKLRRGTDVHGAALQRAALCIGQIYT